MLKIPYLRVALHPNILMRNSKTEFIRRSLKYCSIKLKFGFQRTCRRSFDHELRQETCIALNPCNLNFLTENTAQVEPQTQDLNRYVLVTLKITIFIFSHFVQIAPEPSSIGSKF